MGRPRRQPIPAFSKMIERDLLNAGMSRRQLADRMDLSQGYVSKLVGGKEVPPSEETIRDLAGILGADQDRYLFAARMIPAAMEEAILAKDPADVWAFIREGS
jgi:transcriptional regulator with XRE-family HTH domain